MWTAIQINGTNRAKNSRTGDFNDQVFATKESAEAWCAQANEKMAAFIAENQAKAAARKASRPAPITQTHTMLTNGADEHA